MIPASLAMLLFALSSVAAKRSVSLLGPPTASLLRILLAAAVLGIYAHGWGAGLQGPALGWFIVSGFIGFGICDTAIFLALPRLGAQLTTLMVHCLGAPIAAVTEWLWLGTPLGLHEIGAGGLILAGVAVALFPGRRTTGSAPSLPRPGTFALALGVIAAAGQAWGAVLSRHGQLLSRESGFPMDGMTVSYQRILAGVAFALVWWLWQRGQGGTRPPGNRPMDLRRATPWIILNALCGPSIGVACYQWALLEQKTGVVVAIAALTPLAVIPLSWWLDGERPTGRSVGGGVLAVSGAIWLAVS